MSIIRRLVYWPTAGCEFFLNQPPGTRISAPSSIPPKNTHVRRGAIGILSRHDELLLIRRAAGIAKGGLWCFPGGHVEPGETPKQAVQRELAEELGLIVTATERIGSVRVLESRHILAIWRVVQVGGCLEPSPGEVAEVRWLTPSAIRNLPQGIASNDHVLQLLGV